MLVYSDPVDDGTVTVENGYLPYPYGPARNPTSVQRGSVQFISVYPGDPTTPGYPSYENSTRTEGENIPKIPSLPISWANAESLFRVLRKGDDWEGKQVRLVNNGTHRLAHQINYCLIFYQSTQKSFQSGIPWRSFPALFQQR